VTGTGDAVPREGEANPRREYVEEMLDFEVCDHTTFPAVTAEAPEAGDRGICR
jgi:hypothetical protein